MLNYGGIMKEYLCTQSQCIIALEIEYGIDTGFVPKDCEDCIYSEEIEIEKEGENYEW